MFMIPETKIGHETYLTFENLCILTVYKIPKKCDRENFIYVFEPDIVTKTHYIAKINAITESC